MIVDTICNIKFLIDSYDLARVLLILRKRVSSWIEQNFVPRSALTFVEENLSENWELREAFD